MTYIDPVESSPNNYKVLLETDQARLLEMKIPAGQTDIEHSHPNELVYFITGGKLRIHIPGGDDMEAELPDGAVMDHEPWTHTVENVGTTDVHAIIFELK